MRRLGEQRGGSGEVWRKRESELRSTEYVVEKKNSVVSNATAVRQPPPSVVAAPLFWHARAQKEVSLFFVTRPIGPSKQF